MSFLLFAGALLIFQNDASAVDFYCEILNISGVASVSNSSDSRQSVKEGDLLRPGDTLSVERDSYVDVAYDKDWLNVVRIEADSTVKIRSIVPGNIYMSRGALYAKLKALPKDSTFAVETPDAIASVRGSEYSAVVGDDGTQVFNLAKSEVYIFGKTEGGDDQPDEAPAQILKANEKIEPFRAGQPPPFPLRMSEQDKSRNAAFRQNMERIIRDNKDRGRTSKIQSVKQMNGYLKAAFEYSKAAGSGLLVSTESAANSQKGDNYLQRSDKLYRQMDLAAETYESIAEREAVQAENHRIQAQRAETGKRLAMGGTVIPPAGPPKRPDDAAAVDGEGQKRSSTVLQNPSDAPKDAKPPTALDKAKLIEPEQDKRGKHPGAQKGLPPSNTPGPPKADLSAPPAIQASSGEPNGQDKEARQPQQPPDGPGPKR